MNAMQSDQITLHFTLNRFEETYAVLRHAQHGEIRWPVKYLPDNAKINDDVALCVVSGKQEEDAQYDRMRRLLEELIN